MGLSELPAQPGNKVDVSELKVLVYKEPRGPAESSDNSQYIKRELVQSS